MISITEPVLGELEEKLVIEVLRSGRLAQGPMVERFEEDVRSVVGTEHAVAVDNGTDALIASLVAHGIGPGDEVITSPFTFVATLNAILHVGATPRFVDIGDDFNLDPSLVRDAIGPTTRAIVPVHLFGCPAEMTGIAAAIGGRDLVMIEDAAQALGATHSGRGVGSFGTGCFSFYASKNVTTGEGGMITTNDDAVASTVRILRDQGQRARYDYALPGYNLRLTELQAALGVAQMSRLPDIVESRRANARFLTEGLEGIEGLVLPSEPPGRKHIYHQFTVRVTRHAPITRDRLVDFLLREGIRCGVYYPRPVFDYGCYRRDPRVGIPVTPRASAVAQEVLALPVHPRLTDPDLARIVTSLRAALR
jgi:dTDP-4-amino-4,6-dideoxygalactose transaminase